MADQDVVEVVGNAPKKEQDSDENERNELSCREQSGSRPGIRPGGGVPFYNRQWQGFFGFGIHLTFSTYRDGLRTSRSLLLTVGRSIHLRQSRMHGEEIFA